MPLPLRWDPLRVDWAGWMRESSKPMSGAIGALGGGMRYPRVGIAEERWVASVPLRVRHAEGERSRVRCV